MNGLEKEIHHLARAITELQGFLKDINHRLDKIIMTQAELSVALDKMTAQLGKVAKEQSDRFDALSAEIKRLTDLINAGGDVTAEVAAAITGTQTALDAMDAAIPDAPTP